MSQSFQEIQVRLIALENDEMPRRTLKFHSKAHKKAPPPPFPPVAPKPILISKGSGNSTFVEEFTFEQTVWDKMFEKMPVGFSKPSILTSLKGGSNKEPEELPIKRKTIVVDNEVEIDAHRKVGMCDDGFYLKLGSGKTIPITDEFLQRCSTEQRALIQDAMETLSPES